MKNDVCVDCFLYFIVYLSLRNGGKNNDVEVSDTLSSLVNLK